MKRKTKKKLLKNIMKDIREILELEESLTDTEIKTLEIHYKILEVEIIFYL